MPVCVHPNFAYWVLGKTGKCCEKYVKVTMEMTILQKSPLVNASSNLYRRNGYNL